MDSKDKKLELIMFAGAFIIIFSSLASSGIFDWIKEGTITGRATTSTHTLNISIANTAPSISFVTPVLAQAPFENGIRNFIINFTAHDQDGTGNLNNATARINATKTGEPTRSNATCGVVGNNNSTSANYTCTIPMWFFDDTGAWNITVAINDTDGSFAQNTTQNFTFNTLTANVAGPSVVTFASISSGARNTTPSSGPLLMNNTGNVAIANFSIDLNATDLDGETDSALSIYARNISIGTKTGGTPTAECGGQNVTLLSKSVYTAIANASLPRGNHSIANNATGQENIFICIQYAGNELTGQPYSTSNEGSWTLRVS